jgi:DNA-binding transcriptional MocR family regulator
MMVMLRSLEKHAKEDALHWTRPSGGCTLWATVRGGRREQEQELLDLAAAERVAIAPGSLFFAEPPDQLSFRLSIARVKAHEIEEGCRRLSRALNRLHGSGRGSRTHSSSEN